MDHGSGTSEAKAGQDSVFVKDAFAGIAGRYVLTNHVLSLGIDVWWRRVTAQTVAKLDPATIIDLATGSGDLARSLQAACPAAHILGADFSVPMMRVSQQSGFQNLIAADAMHLPVKDSAFDMVTVAFGLRNMADWAGALREMHRVLKPGGHIVLLDFSLPSSRIIRACHLMYLKHIMPVLAGALTGKRDAYEYLCTSIEKFPSGDQMKSLLVKCGFSNPTSRPLTLGIASLYTASRQINS
jgi:demethylmenaquinone methyltransferase/2-methoxy-6-polyprenyl-1,4-benzoquinol methylase